MRDEWVRDLKSWAAANDCVRQLWLFGSRARGDAEHSDIDLAAALMPPDGKHDWALGMYYARGDEWQRELETIVGRRHVSLEAIKPGTDADELVRRCGVLLWAREVDRVERSK